MSVLSELKKHVDFINKKFSIKCHNIFTKEEEEILIQYGEWMSALENGILKPVTIAQEHFIEVCKNNVPPETEYEQTWIKYKKRIQWEDKYGDTSDIPPVRGQRDWEGLTGPDKNSFYNTYQI